MAPHTPQPSAPPGPAGARLDNARDGGAELPVYSYLSASIGSRRAALWAG